MRDEKEISLLIHTYTHTHTHTHKIFFLLLRAALTRFSKNKQSVSKLGFSNFKFQEECVSLCFKERVQRVIMIIIETIEAIGNECKKK